MQYRPFHNSDPSKLVDLWHQCRLGRGAAAGFSYDAFELMNFAQPYFDSNGLIVAYDGSNAAGFVHAGFGANPTGEGLSYESGVICAVMVHPDYRRQGIGAELVSRAERYLESAGAQTIFAGPAEPRDPYYVGLYGGSQPSGFLESDSAADPFFRAAGYVPVEYHGVFQRDIIQQNEPISVRLMTIRRQTRLAITGEPRGRSWWWLTRFGRLDTLQFSLVPKEDGPPFAEVTAVGLDLYLHKWQQRAVGLVHLCVFDPDHHAGYAQALILEVCRRLRDELVTQVEVHLPESGHQCALRTPLPAQADCSQSVPMTNRRPGQEASAVTGEPVGVDVYASAGFKRIDTGVVYCRQRDLSRLGTAVAERASETSSDEQSVLETTVEFEPLND